MSDLLNSKLKKVTPYVPGEQPQDKKYIKLNTNESPYPVSQTAEKILKEELDKIRLYPDPDLKELTKAVADNLGVSEKNVLLTNGSDEILNFAFMAYCDREIPAVFADITYGFYKVFAEINDTAYKIIPLKDDLSINPKDYYDVKGTIFIANPNAPTGLTLSLIEIEEILKTNPKNVVVIDEAYVDFGGETAVSLINKYDNLLVTRTFSKSRSMAGARLGFGVASEKIISDLTTVKYSTNPYNVNRLTAAVGYASIKDDEYFKDCVRKVIATRENTKTELRKLGFSITDSHANFIFAKTDKVGGEEMYLKLKEKGILVRHFKTDTIKDYIRISIGSQEDMQTFIEKVKEILGEL